VRQVDAERRKQCVPTQSVGTRANGRHAERDEHKPAAGGVLSAISAHIFGRWRHYTVGGAIREQPLWTTVNTRTDGELVEAARDGDVESFGELYRRHYAAVVGMAYSVVADRHLAEDAAQEAFVVACRELPRLRRGERFGPWIGTIAKWVAGRMTRSRRDRGLVAEQTVVAPAANPGPHTNDLVRQAVEDLPRRAREVVVLHYFTGLSHKEIAASLGVSAEAVHGRLVRARRILADRLLGNGMGDLEL
jgi:RNA polymerase sigma-70 factor, ECF subfamily